MKIGFIGLGNVGAKLAGSVLRNGYCLFVNDVNPDAAKDLIANGAQWAATPKALTEQVELVITCLPSPQISASVMEDEDGILAGFSEGKFWAEMSTTNADEVKRLGKKIEDCGGEAIDCPVSGGCHRAATGNISIFAGCKRSVFEALLPIFSRMGRNILHTGDLGSASVLKVLTNYLASANLLSVCEALVTAKAAGMDLNTTYEAIRISSGTSFVHETESQVILNGSRDINFTMDLVIKDLSLFQQVADKANVPLELSPMLLKIFKEAAEKYGDREWSPNIIRRLEDATGLSVLASGFPEQMVDDEPEVAGSEVIVKR